MGGNHRLPISPPGTDVEAMRLLFRAALVLIVCYFVALYLSKRVITPTVIAVVFGGAILFLADISARPAQFQQ